MPVGMGARQRGKVRLLPLSRLVRDRFDHIRKRNAVFERFRQDAAAGIRGMDVAFTDKTSQLAKIGSGRRAGFESLRFPSNS